VTLADISIRRPVFAWMLMTAMIVFGAISLFRLGVSQMPDIDFPVLNVNINWDGAAPEVLEAELVDQVEQKVIAIEGIKEIRSSVRQGAANVEIEFNLSRNIDAALQEVQAAISQIRLPLGVNTPTIGKNSTEAEPIMWIGVTSGSMSMRDLTKFCDDFLVDQFQIIPGVGEVTLGGFNERNFRVWVDNDKLKKYELSILDVQDALAQEHVEVAGGYLENNKKELNVRTMGEGFTEEALGNVIIPRRGGQPIYDTAIRLKDIGRVEDGLNDIRRLARVSGKEGLAVGIKKQRGTNEVEVGRAVKARIAELAPLLPKGVEMQVNVDFTRFSEQAVNYTEDELLVAAIVTTLICFLFLGSFSSALNVILAIPTSILGTFTVLYFLDFTLNTFTLLALALVIGIVVDDAIMVLENIVRHFQMGKGKVRAAREGARQVTFAAVAATVAVVAIFLPIVFMEGIIGRFLFQFGITITAAVLLSLVEALTLTPMRCAAFMQRERKQNAVSRVVDPMFRRLAENYREFLQIALRLRWTVVIASTILFLLSLSCFYFMRKEMVPTQDQNFLRLVVKLPVGSSLAATNAALLKVEDYIKKQPEVDLYFTVVGGGGGVPNEGFGAVTFVDKDKRKLSQSELALKFTKEIKQLVPGAFVAFTDLSARGLTSRRSQPVEFNLRGPSYGELEKASKEIRIRLEATGLVTDLDTNYKVGQPETHVIPDREAASLRGVSMENIGETINAAIGGVREGKYTNDGKRYDVRIRLEPGQRETEGDISKLQVRTNYGELIPLTDVVKIETVPTIQTVSRVNRQRSISITANLTPGASQSTALAAAEKISRGVLPPGYTFNLEGGAQAFAETGMQLLFVFILGLVVAYMVLAAQFNSFIHPVTVIIPLFFSLTGGGLALLLTGQSLNLYSGISFILLMGIAKKNSIMLVEFTNQLREEGGMPIDSAIFRACPIRLRPILMTSIATMGAALPLAIAAGPGSETRTPMAVVIIGGTLVSTVFTLFVVPCLYKILSPLEHHPDHDTRAEDEADAPDTGHREPT
jgi:hydrophobe/amphiphile efflux-1 (HAE1) family protein